MSAASSPSRVARCRAELRLALSVALVGGTLLGAREGLLTLNANSFVQPGQYFFAYLAVPILLWMALGGLLLLPVGLLRGLSTSSVDTGRSLPLYAVVLGFAGALSIVGPSVARLTGDLREVGFEVGRAGFLALWLATLVLAGGIAAGCGAAAAWYAARTPMPLRHGTRAALLVGVLCLWPLGRFLATDWTWPRADGAREAAPTAEPNVVLISIDTLRADHVGSYGSPYGLTPSLDRLATEGVVFQHTTTSSPWTLPAVGSLMTGLYPRHHGAGAVTNRRDPLGRSALPEGSWTLAGALRARGYRTHAIVTNPYLALRYGLGRGFEGYENLTIESEFFLAGRDTTAVRLLNWLAPEVVIGDRGDTVSQRATRWLERAGPGRPFLLWLHYIDPHAPYSRAGATRHKSFRSDSLLGTEHTAATRFTVTSPDVARLRSGEIRLSDDQKEAVRALYRDEVASVDAAVGRVLDALDRLGLRERTLVVCVSDHGEEFWEHGGVEHGHTVYDELVQVPLIMRWPGHLPAGTVVGAVTRTTDIAPTVLELLGIPASQPFDGLTLLPLLRGEETAARVALVENLLFADARVGLRTPDGKYVRWDTGKEEAYDLAADPREQRDLAGVPPVLGPLRELHAQVEPGLAERSLAASAVPSRGSSSAALRILGYVQ